MFLRPGSKNHPCCEQFTFSSILVRFCLSGDEVTGCEQSVDQTQIPEPILPWASSRYPSSWCWSWKITSAAICFLGRTRSQPGKLWPFVHRQTTSRLPICEHLCTVSSLLIIANSSSPICGRVWWQLHQRMTESFLEEGKQWFCTDLLTFVYVCFDSSSDEWWSPHTF